MLKKRVNWLSLLGIEPGTLGTVDHALSTNPFCHCCTDASNNGIYLSITLNVITVTVLPTLHYYKPNIVLFAPPLLVRRVHHLPFLWVRNILCTPTGSRSLHSSAKVSRTTAKKIARTNGRPRGMLHGHSKLTHRKWPWAAHNIVHWGWLYILKRQHHQPLVYIVPPVDLTWLLHMQQMAFRMLRNFRTFCGNYMITLIRVQCECQDY